MVWNLRNPKTGELYQVPEVFNEETQSDTNKDEAIAKGYQVVSTVVNPKTSEEFDIPEEELEGALTKGYKLPEQHAMEKRVEANTVEVPDWVSATLGASQGMTFGLADEVSSAVGAAIDALKGKDFSDSYEQRLDIARRTLGFAESDDPFITGIADVVASIAMPIPGGSAIKALKGAKKAKAIVVTGGALGALEAFGRTQEDKISQESLKEVMIGAGIGAGLGLGLHTLGSVWGKANSPKLKNATAEKIAEITTESKYAIAEKAIPVAQKRTEALYSRVGKELDISDTKLVADELYKVKDISEFGELIDNSKSKSMLSKLKRHIMPNAPRDKYDEALATKWDRLTPEKRRIEVESFILKEAQLKATKSEQAKLYKELGIKPDDPLLTELGRLTGEPNIIARNMDEVAGTQLEPTLADITRANDTVTNLTNVHIKGQAKLNNIEDVQDGVLYGIEDIMSKFSKSKLDDKKFGQMFTGKMKPTPEYEPYITAVRSHYDNIKGYANANGFAVKELKDYMNMISLDPADLHNVLKEQKAKFEVIAKNIGDIEFDDLERALEVSSNWQKLGIDEMDADLLLKELSELKGMGRRLTGHPINSFKTISVAADEALKQKGKKSFGYELGILQERTGELPDQFREFNPFKNLLAYANSTYKSVHMEDALRSLDTHIEIANSLGWNRTASYFKNLMGDVSGHELGGIAMFHKNANGIKAKLRVAAKEAKGFEKIPIKAAQAALDYSSAITGITYKSLLGANIKSAIQNLITVPATGIPTVGGVYGVNKMSQALLDVAKDGGNILNNLRRKNIYSEAERLKEMQGVFELVESGVTNLPGVKSLNKVADGMMHLFMKGEQVGIAASYKMGKNIASDFLSGHKSAAKFMKTLPAGIKTRIRTNPKQALDAEWLGDVIGRHLKGEIMLNYDKAHLSEAARQWGPVVRMFSKWPTTMANRSIYAAKNITNKKGWKQASILAAPFAYFTLLQNIREANVNPNSAEGKLLEYTMGKDISTMAPVTSLTGGLLASPLIGIGIEGTKTAVGVLTGDKTIKDVADFGYKTFKTIGPIAPLNAALRESDKYNRIYNNKRNTGSDFIKKNVPDVSVKDYLSR